LEGNGWKRWVTNHRGGTEQVGRQSERTIRLEKAPTWEGWHFGRKTLSSGAGKVYDQGKEDRSRGQLKKGERQRVLWKEKKNPLSAKSLGAKIKTRNAGESKRGPPKGQQTRGKKGKTFTRGRREEKHPAHKDRGGPSSTVGKGRIRG